MKVQSLERLKARRGTTLADLHAKVEAEDWHGVQDCASDLREIDAMIDALSQSTAEPWRYSEDVSK